MLVCMRWIFGGSATICTIKTILQTEQKKKRKYIRIYDNNKKNKIYNNVRIYHKKNI